MLVLGRRLRQGFVIWKKDYQDERIDIELVSRDRKSVTLRIKAHETYSCYLIDDVFERNVIRPEEEKFVTIQQSQSLFIKDIYEKRPFEVVITFIRFEPSITFAIGASKEYEIYRDELEKEGRIYPRNDYRVNRLEYF